MRAAQSQKDQHASIRRVVSLPLVLICDSLANFLRFLPGGAWLVAVRFQRSLDFGDALRSGLHLHFFRAMLIGVSFRRRSRYE